jgi:FkbM family methyltransferase
MMHGFLEDNVERFKRILIGSGFSSLGRLFLMAILESAPAALRRQISALDITIDHMRDRLSISLTLSVRGVKYRVRNFEDLQVLNPRFERFMSAWFQPKKGDVFVDIGSHVGKYSISTAKAVGKEGLVIAVEPHPETFLALKKNAALNHIQNVLFFNIAAWNTSENVRFHVGGSASEFSAYETGYEKSIDVPAKRMDDLLIGDLKLKRVDWIKIDVEKAETQVLEGLNATLQKYKPRFFMEVWPENMVNVKAFAKKQKYSLIMVSNVLGSPSNACIYLVGIPTPI